MMWLGLRSHSSTRCSTVRMKVVCEKQATTSRWRYRDRHGQHVGKSLKLLRSIAGGQNRQPAKAGKSSLAPTIISRCALTPKPLLTLPACMHGVPDGAVSLIR